MGLVKQHHVNAGIYLAVSVLNKGILFLLIPLYTRHLSPTDYGLYGLCQTLFSLVPPIVSLGMSTALARFYFDHKDPAARDRTVGGIVVAVLVMALLGGALGEVAIDLAPGGFVGGLAPLHLRLALWASVSLAVAELPILYFRAAERPFAYAAYSLAQVIVVAGTSYVLVARMGAGLLGLLVAMLSGQALGALYTLAFTFVRLRPVLTRRLLGEAARYSLPFVPHIIGNSLMVGSDRWILEYYHLGAELGLYTLATQLTLPVMLVASAWNEASSPRFYAQWRDGGYPAARAALPRVVAGFVVGGLGALGAVLCGLPILRLLIGPRFQPAFPLVPWIGLGLVAGTLFSAFVNVITLRKDSRIIPVLTLSAVVVNVVLNLLLVPRLHVYGAILGTGLAYAFRTALLGVVALRELRRTGGGVEGGGAAAAAAAAVTPAAGTAPAALAVD